jgi:hypothetical protein
MIPEEIQPLVDRLRRYLDDFPEVNELIEKEESSDQYLYEALEDALTEINEEYPPAEVKWNTLLDAPWTILKTGAVLSILVGKGISSARNQLSYSDAGGLQIREFDTYGKYMAFYNMLIAKHSRSVMAAKRAKNIEGTYGGVHSEYIYNI